jgi:hypothetical protein
MKKRDKSIFTIKFKKLTVCIQLKELKISINKCLNRSKIMKKISKDYLNLLI